MIQLKTLFFLILLGITIIVATMLNRDIKEISVPTTLATSNSYYLQKFELTVLDESGTKSYSVEGKTLEQNTVTGVSLITSPYSIIYKQGQSHWKIRSDRGSINEDQSHITLTDNVHAENITEQAINMETKSLDIFLNEHRIVTEETVTIFHAAGQLSGTGMQADLNDNTIRLNANIKGSYDP